MSAPNSSLYIHHRDVWLLSQAIGRYNEAEPLLLEASKVQQRTLGHDHPHTVASLSNLATVYDAMGEPERAKAMQVTRTQIWKKSTSSAS